MTDSSACHQPEAASSKRGEVSVKSAILRQSQLRVRTTVYCGATRYRFGSAAGLTLPLFHESHSRGSQAASSLNSSVYRARFALLVIASLLA